MDLHYFRLPAELSTEMKIINITMRQLYQFSRQKNAFRKWVRTSVLPMLATNNITHKFVYYCKNFCVWWTSKRLGTRINYLDEQIRRSICVWMRLSWYTNTGYISTFKRKLMKRRSLLKSPMISKLTCEVVSNLQTHKSYHWFVWSVGTLLRVFNHFIQAFKNCT